MTSLPIEISWHAGAPPPELELEEDALRDLLAGFLAALGHAERGLSVLIADDKTLRALNRRFREQDRPTDVLSWSYRGEDEAPALLGELAVSLERARAQADENGWHLRTELLRLLAHGCAHLAGYGHESEEDDRVMRAVEIKLLEGAGLPGLYPEG